MIVLGECNAQCETCHEVEPLAKGVCRAYREFKLALGPLLAEQRDRARAEITSLCAVSMINAAAAGLSMTNGDIVTLMQTFAETVTAYLHTLPKETQRAILENQKPLVSAAIRALEDRCPRNLN